MAGRVVKVWRLGRINYGDAQKVQTALAQLHHSSPNDDTLNSMLLLEHTPVYTVGIRRKDYTEDEAERLRATGADFYETNRGGLITFHGPGQLVAYPIINLRQFKESMRWYVCHIEKTIIDLCRKFSLDASTSPHTGVWIGDNKVCAIGVHGSRFITTHGLALNCNVDLNWFNNIVPCGIIDKGVTSLSKEANVDISVESVIPKFLDSFSDIFRCSFVEFREEQKDDLLTKLCIEKPRADDSVIFGSKRKQI
ncbi:PREDICTED: putative lipoyltransferase 2, mitochondrial [Nicrophorus vespilloides]|uniref:Octanoyl-[acyl-carrier-protein]:protein N-octanoyltransferase LIPT2, mitochondrial n=1 Tax=Nicrophorus vespilloides TaxID=110193 RepID=A0ABM1M0P4_NICVS|nr:PREDICTED: putative lipoyltransferase 2, mitochondrial [Nicrophorus vespilloides]